MAKKTSLALVPSSPAVALSNMSVPQLTSACHMLSDCQDRYDKLSGICATMRGLVLTEVKHKLAHGKFLPWIAENLGKTRKTAAQDMRLAGEFFKCNPQVTFETLGRDLATTLKEIEEAQLDLRHPLVRAVASFVGDRTRYQLLLDFPGGGYDRSVAGVGKTGVTALTRRLQVVERLVKPLNQITKLWFSDGLWMELTPKELRDIDGDLAEMRVLIKKQLSK